MRRRILVSLVGLTALAVIAFGAPLAYAARRLYHDEEVQRVQREAAEAAQHVPDTFATGSDPIDFPSGNQTTFTLYDASGRRVKGRGPVSPDAPVRAALRGNVADSSVSGSLVAAVPVSRQEQAVGAAVSHCSNSA